jgi:hypothetical protein
LTQESYLSDDGAGFSIDEKFFSHGLMLLDEEERPNAVDDEDCPPFIGLGLAGQ